MNRTIFPTLCAAAAGCWLAAGHCFAAADAPKPTEVKTAAPQRGEVYRFVTLPGSIKANQQATLYAKVSGYLKTMTVDKGDHVTAGQLLGEIEVPELAADAVKYRAEVKVAEAESARLDEARKASPDLVTPQSLDEAHGRLDIAKANLERTETLLNYSRLTAPFNGVVTMRYVDPGAFIPVATAGSTPQAAAVVTLMDFNTVRAQVAVPELEAALLRVGQPVRVGIESLPGRSFEGAVSRQSYALDEATRTVLVEADLPNADLTLRPGMYATVRIGVEKHTDVLLVPSAALVTEKAGTSVFVAANGVAKKIPVKAGFNDGANAEILSGLTGKEAVVLTGKLALTDGAAIHVTEAK